MPFPHDQSEFQLPIAIRLTVTENLYGNWTNRIAHSIYNMKNQEFTFNPGPIFTNLLLADEINRAPAKTQSSLLEAMQERQVTVDGATYPLELPFITIATQNPLEQEGTYPLPEAQLDRFMFKLLVDYPTTEQENDILTQFATGKDNRNLDEFNLEPVMQAEEILSIQSAIRHVIVEPSVVSYITSIVTKTRSWHSIEVGASPRASVNILLASRAMAVCRGRDFVIPDDTKDLTVWVLRHRLRLRPDAKIDGITPDDVIQDVLDSVEAPADDAAIAASRFDRTGRNPACDRHRNSGYKPDWRFAHVDCNCNRVGRSCDFAPCVAD
jgi:MoxR-like ATPase